MRHDNPALQANEALLFQPIDNDQLIAYSKVHRRIRRCDTVVIVVVNLDLHHRQSGWVQLDLAGAGSRSRTCLTRCTIC